MPTTTTDGACADQAPAHRFYAHARAEGRHRDHPVPGAANLQDAAMIFAEHWLPLAVAEGDDVSVIVRDGDSGEEQCFTVHLGSGDAEPCA